MARRQDGGLLLGLVVGATLLWPLAGSAEVATDGTLGAKVRLTGKDVKVPARLGQIRGKNLFHSFERFGIETGNRVTFTGPDGLKNVIGRVTGGTPSSIDGTLASAVKGADLWLLNPAGILFGPNARLDVPGSFHASTADELRFADGKVFSALDPQGSVLSVAVPQSFGLLGAKPAGITVDRSVLDVPEGKALSLVGGDVTGSGAGAVRARGGRVTLTALGGPGAVDVASGAATGEVSGTVRLIDRALVDTSGEGGGTIRIRGGRLVVEDASSVVADNTGASHAAGGVAIAADTVEIRSGGAIRTSARGAGNAGDVTVAATDRMTIADQGVVETDSTGSGAADDISIRTPRLKVRDGGEISSSSSYIGFAGDVQLMIGTLEVEDASIRTDGFGSQGGRIDIAALDLIYLKDAKVTSSGILPAPGASVITLNAPLIAMNNSWVLSLTGSGAPLAGSGKL
jgi:filamentous hemagglutinin family protein